MLYFVKIMVIYVANVMYRIVQCTNALLVQNVVINLKSAIVAY